MKICFIIDKNLNPNSYAFIFPILINKKNFSSFDIDIISKDPEKIYDLIFIDSKYYITQFKNNDFNFISNNLIQIKNKCKKLIYCDNEASIFINKNLFKYVDTYLKGRLPADINTYKKELYGQRQFTDFYHKKYNIRDNAENYSNIIEDDQLKKIILGWNNGICDYSYFSIVKKLIFKLSGKIFLSTKFQILNKKKLISARIKQKYNRNTINYHRNIYEKLLSNYCNIERISRNQYFKELKNSKFSFSPFGWGEICYRDFESFLYKCILIKPNMSHIKTWPDFYIENKTYISTPWDLNNRNLIDKIFENEEEFKKIGEFGHENYIKYLNNDDNSIFTKYFENLIKNIIQ